MSDLEPEQAAHVAPGGPAAVAAAWFSAIVDRSDLAAAWRLTDRPLRLALVQSWLMHIGRAGERDRDAIANTLADGPGHRDWAEFVSWRLTRWRSATFATFVAQGWGLVTTPEYVAPDLEFVRVAPGRHGRRFQANEPLLVQTLTVRLVEGKWLVAGIGRTLALPGWPPGEEELPTDFAR